MPTLQFTDEKPGRDEQATVEAWRLQQLLNAGYTHHRAEQLAARTDINLHTATDLLRDGCAQHLALKILL